METAITDLWPTQAWRIRLVGMTMRIVTVGFICLFVQFVIVAVGGGGGF